VDQFQDDVREALEHLYDYMFLENHPLAVAVDGEANGWKRGTTLHRLLVETINRLKPPDGTPSHSPLWRRYRHAAMRYIEKATVIQIAEELGVSERQTRRDRQDAILAVADLLEQRLGTALRAYQEGARASAPITQSAAAMGLTLDKEVARISTPEPHSPVPLSDALAGVLSIVAHLASKKELRLRTRSPDHLPPLASECTVVRQILLSVVMWVVELAAPFQEIEVVAEVERGNLRVGSAFSLAEPASSDRLEAAEGRLAVGSKLASMQGGSIRTGRSGAAGRIELVLPTAQQPTVLIVDDNPGMRRLMRRYLSGRSYLVLEASNATDALRLATDVQPDAVTLDLMMPTTDGWELLQTLRSQPRTRQIPIVVCSVLKERDLALSLGAADFLAKPITRDALLQALSGVVATG